MLRFTIADTSIHYIKVEELFWTIYSFHLAGVIHWDLILKNIILRQSSSSSSLPSKTRANSEKHDQDQDRYHLVVIDFAESKSPHIESEELPNANLSNLADIARNRRVSDRRGAYSQMEHLLGEKLVWKHVHQMLKERNGSDPDSDDGKFKEFLEAIRGILDAREKILDEGWTENSWDKYFIR